LEITQRWGKMHSRTGSYGYYWLGWVEGMGEDISKWLKINQLTMK